jgi:FAD/FMN-containing dehydrogenase
VTGALEQLRDGFTGRVIGPDEQDYDDLRMVMAPIDRRPLAIARPSDASSVADTIEFASEAGLPIAVRSGGHSGAGHGVLDDGIVIDLRDMRSLEIDAEGLTATVEPGLTAGEVTEALGREGLAVGFGDSASVGIGGLTLGGGVGFLGRLYGLTVDNLLAAQVVTATGEILDVDAETHPDLFWAIRGGGGNFGVVTRFVYRLERISSVVGGMVLMPAEADALASFLAAADAAPDELSTIVNVMPAPPLPFIPEDRLGELIMMGQFCFAGPADEAERVLAPFRALGEPIADMVKAQPYSDLIEPVPEGYRPLVAMRNTFVDDVGIDRIRPLLETLEENKHLRPVAQFRVLGGAINRVPAEATAYAHRDRRFMVNLGSFYEDPAELADRVAWVESLVASVDGSGASVNFLTDEPEARVRAAYPGKTWDRLAAIKARYDPGNVFRSTQNVPPAEPAAG